MKLHGLLEDNDAQSSPDSLPPLVSSVSRALVQLPLLENTHFASRSCASPFNNLVVLRTTQRASVLLEPTVLPQNRRRTSDTVMFKFSKDRSRGCSSLSLL